MNTLAVFKSRSEAMRLYTLLSSKRYACALIDTPASVGGGCGLSVVFDSGYQSVVGEAISAINSKSFMGFYVKNR